MASILDRLAQFAPQQTKTNTGGNDLLSSLVGAYGAFNGGNGAYDALGNSNGNINQQIQYLQDMYNPNGAVAQQYAKELAAKDAAAGRNSQYATRSALLQAKLAEGASRNAATINQLSATQTQQQLQQQQIRAQQLASLFNVAKTSGLTGWAENGLRNLFNTEQPNTPDYSIGTLPNSGSPQGLDTTLSNTENPYSIQTGKAPGMQFDVNAFMPDFSAQAPAPTSYPMDNSQLGWLDQQ